MTTTDDLTTLDAAEQELRDRTAAEAEALARRRAEVTSGLERARRDAAQARLDELNQMIPANTARGEAARAALLDAVRDGGNVIDALTTIVETHKAHHALNLEASSMEATLGLPTRPTPRQLAAEPMTMLADAITTVAASRVPKPVALPTGGPTLTHEQKMERERQRHHGDQLLALYLEMQPDQIAALTSEQYAAKLAEAEREKQRREAEVAAQSLANEQDRRRPAFRQVVG